MQKKRENEREGGRMEEALLWLGFLAVVWQT